MLKTIFSDKDFYTERGQKFFNQLFNTKEKIFQSPKSPLLIKSLIKTCLSDNAIILDFFAGSGTTAHAALKINKEDNGNCKYVLIQLPEPTGRKDYKTISDICKERVRRVINKIKEEEDGNLELDNKRQQSLGFRVFKLAESNFKPWGVQAVKDEKTLEKQLEMHVDHILEDRTADDILYELLLKSGYTLTTPVDRITLADKTVYSVDGGALIICLDKKLTAELVHGMADRKPERIICLDDGFSGNDQLKTNAVQIFKTRGIVFKTV
jgi:adenine-specific DNA-methyltransferase